MQKIIPLGNRLIIEFLEVEEKSQGGLIIPEEARQKDQFDLARVLEIGTGVRSQYTGEVIPMTVQIGDIIALNPHSARFVKMGLFNQIMYANEHDVIAILRDVDEADVIDIKTKKKINKDLTDPA